MGFTSWIASALTLLSAASAVASLDPEYARDLERHAKAARLRKFHDSRPRFHGLLPVAAPAADPFSIVSYRFDLELDPAKARLSGTAAVDLLVDPQAEPLEELTFDAVNLGISKAWLEPVPGLRLEAMFTATADKVTVKLPHSFRAGQRFTILFAYAIHGDKRDGKPAAEVGTRGIFFVNSDGAERGIPPTIYTLSEPELARSWFPCIDDPSKKARRMEMRLTVPEGWQAVSNGALVSVTPAADRRVVFEWVHSYPIPSYLISIAASPYSVIEDRWREMPVRYYVPAELVERARSEFQRTPAMVEHFSTLWGDYPFEKYAMASVPMLDGAMEHTTATTISEDSITGNRENESLVAHELSHHWWGNVVTMGNWDHLWLNEGFATFSEILFSEKFESPVQAMEGLLRARERTFEEDQEASKAIVDPAVAPDNKFTPTVYEKGAWVLHMLRGQVGDASFFSGLRTYFERHAFKNAVTDNLRRVFEEVSGKKLERFFRQWVFGKGYPSVRLSWRYDRSTRKILIEARQKGRTQIFDLPLELKVLGVSAAGETLALALDLPLVAGQGVLARVLPEGFPEPRAIQVDPEIKILGRFVVERAAPEVRFLMTQPDWRARLDAVNGLRGEISGDTLMLARELATGLAAETSASVRDAVFALLPAVRPLPGFSEADLSRFQQAIRTGLTDSDVSVRVRAAAAAGSFLSEDFLPFLFERLAVDVSPRVRARLAVSVARSRDPRVFEVLERELRGLGGRSQERTVITGILEAMGVLGDRRALPVLQGHVEGSNLNFQAVAVESLGRMGDAAVLESLVELLQDEERPYELRASAAKGLGHFGGASAAKALSDQFEIEKDLEVKRAIRAALDTLGGKPSLGSV